MASVGVADACGGVACFEGGGDGVALEFFLFGLLGLPICVAAGPCRHLVLVVGFHGFCECAGAFVADAEGGVELDFVFVEEGCDGFAIGGGQVEAVDHGDEVVAFVVERCVLGEGGGASAGALEAVPVAFLRFGEDEAEVVEELDGEAVGGVFEFLAERLLPLHLFLHLFGVFGAHLEVLRVGHGFAERCPGVAVLDGELALEFEGEFELFGGEVEYVGVGADLLASDGRRAEEVVAEHRGAEAEGLERVVVGGVGGGWWRGGDECRGDGGGDEQGFGERSAHDGVPPVVVPGR